MLDLTCSFMVTEACATRCITTLILISFFSDLSSKIKKKNVKKLLFSGKYFVYYSWGFFKPSIRILALALPMILAMSSSDASRIRFTLLN